MSIQSISLVLSTGDDFSIRIADLRLDDVVIVPTQQ